MVNEIKRSVRVVFLTEDPFDITNDYFTTFVYENDRDNRRRLDETVELIKRKNLDVYRVEMRDEVTKNEVHLTYNLFPYRLPVDVTHITEECTNLMNEPV